MGTFVTLAEVLEARGSPLEEEEVWCLLLATTEALLDISKTGEPLHPFIQFLVQASNPGDQFGCPLPV